MFLCREAQVPLPYLFAKEGNSKGKGIFTLFLIVLPFLCKPRQLSVCVSIQMSCFPSLYVLQAISFDLLKHSPGDYWSNQKAYYLSCALFLLTQFNMSKTTRRD